MADNLSPSSADVTESGSLNLPEPSGPHRAVMELLYLFTYMWVSGQHYIQATLSRKSPGTHWKRRDGSRACLDGFC
jgi:hypothetical protein